MSTPLDRKRYLLSVKIDTLRPDPRNTKIHTDAQIDLIAKSIKVHGYIDPIEVDEQNNIINGHGRLKAIQKLQAEGEWEGDEVQVIVLDISSQHRRRAYGIAHNQLTLSTSFDFVKMRDEMSELGITTDDLIAGGGFDFDSLRLLEHQDDAAFKKIKEDSDAWSHLVEKVYKVDLAFRTEDDQMDWMNFIQYLAREYPNQETIADRIMLFIEETANGA